MPSRVSKATRAILRGLMVLIVLKVTIEVIASYRHYFPPDFSSLFLLGRQSYFWGVYCVAFYCHVISGPIVILLGLIALNQRVRIRWAMVHRMTGRTFGLVVLGVVSPSGLAMACYADGGVPVSISFSILAVLTGCLAGLGWRSAIKRRWNEHRQWMIRCYLMICSAIVLRVMGGAWVLVGIREDWTYVVSSWACWLAPLFIYELILRHGRQTKQNVELTLASDSSFT